MNCIIIDGIKCEYENARNVLEVALKNGIDIPNLCYCDTLSTYGGCRLCVVENEKGGVEAACTMVPKDGMKIRTNTPQLREYRRGMLELLLSSHNAECSSCRKSGSCKLQEYAKRYGVETSSEHVYCSEGIDASSFSIVRDPSKCILCGKCVRVCDEIQNVRAIDFMHRGNKTFISCGDGLSLRESNCVGCGQCAAVCPTAAIMIKDNVSDMWTAIESPAKKVAVAVAPAVRIGLAEEFGLPQTQPVMGKIVTALKLMGADLVFDAALCAYQTQIEEAADFAERRSGGTVFSSYCPAWVKHVECDHPDLLPRLSAAGSPMEVCAALIREHYSDDDLVSVALMSCSAAKSEAKKQELVKNGKALVDMVLTTSELARMIREYGMNFAALPDTPCDNFFAQVTGGGKCGTPVALKIDPEKCIGCTKCAKRCPVSAISGQARKPHVIDMDKCIRCRTCKVGCPKDAISEAASMDDLRVAVVNGLAEADMLIEKLKSGEVQYDFVEVMACPDGCPSGGGQPESCIVKKAERRSGTVELDFEMQSPASELPSVAELVNGREKELFRVR